MAKRKKKRRKTGKMPPGLARYWKAKNKRRAGKASAPVAKKRKRRSSGRRRSAARRGRRRGGGGGIMGAISGDVEVMVAGGVYGFVERKAKTEADFPLNKVPKPIDALGFAGNTALALYLAHYFTRNPYLKVGARAVATIASYQLARKGETFKSGSEHFTVAGDDELVLGDDEMAELDGPDDDDFIDGDDDDVLVEPGP